MYNNKKILKGIFLFNLSEYLLPLALHSDKNRINQLPMQVYYRYFRPKISLFTKIEEGFNIIHTSISVIKNNIK